MKSLVELRGMTWDHPRGVDPLNAHAKQYEAAHGVKITWDARLLEDFETYPLDELAERYDLLVIDHPHVGMAAAHRCLLPFDVPPRGETVGNSHESYHFAGEQWALAIDAAAQVSCRRIGAIDHWPRNWNEVTALAAAGRVLCPLAPVHALMCFYTLCANAGYTCATEGPRLIDAEVAQSVLTFLREFAARLPGDCFDLNPIGVFERMLADDQFIYSPLIYGYVTYTRGPAARLEFGDIAGVSGSTLGGTGIAVSARSRHRDQAVAVARDLAAAETQRGLYASAGGQPAHRDAWNDDAVNAATHDFYRNTLATLDDTYLRPRFDGYVAFQHAAGERVAACLKDDAPIASTVDRLNDAFASAQGLS